MHVQLARAPPLVHERDWHHVDVVHGLSVFAVVASYQLSSRKNYVDVDWRNIRKT